jgi:hypothetical protein
MKKQLTVVMLALIVIFTLSGCSKSAEMEITSGQNSLTGQITTSTQQLSVTQKTTPSLSRNGIKGDVNQDGIVDMGDAVMIEKMILGNIPQSDIADVNGDGVINMGDMITIQQILLGHN